MRENVYPSIFQEIRQLSRTINESIIKYQNIRQTINQISPMAEMLHRQHEQIKEFFGFDFKQGIISASNDVEKFKLIMMDFNFPPHNTLSIKQMRLIVKHYNEEGVESTNELLTKFLITFYSKERIELLREKWMELDWLKSRIYILNEAIDCHFDGKYYASVSTLLPQIEGIIAERGELNGFIKQSQLKESVGQILNQTGQFSLDSAVSYFYIKSVLDNFSLGEEVKSPLSRHAILHGADTKYGYELNSIRTILLFDYLVQKYNDPDEE